MGTCRKVRSAFARYGGLFTGTAREHRGADLGAGIKVLNIKDLVKPRKTLRGVLPEKSKNCLKQRNI